MAQSLHRTRSMTVGIISTNSFGRFTLPIFQALEEQFAGQGIAIFMCNATDDPERERQHLDQLLGKRIDGLVVTARRADLRPPVGPLPPGLPVIYVFSQADDREALCLLPDDEGGARLAVRHLAEQGCRRIAHISGPGHFEAVQLRGAAMARLWPSSASPSRRGSIAPAAGRRPGGARRWRSCSTAPRRRRTGCSAAMTRSGAARSRRCASAASPCRARWRCAASTTGK